MSNPLIQFLVLLFLLFAIHVYYLIINAFKRKEKRINQIILKIALVLLGIGIILLTFGSFYNEFLTDGKTLSNTNDATTTSITNWGYFGSYFGGIVAPILTFITLIILIRQIEEARKSNKLQIEHMETTRKIELLIERINYTSNKANEKIDQLHPLDDDIVKLYIENDPELRQQQVSLKSITNDYNNKITYVKLSNETVFPLEWRGIVTYLNMYINKYKQRNRRMNLIAI